MIQQIEKSGTGINRSGTGIEKSGTGKPRSNRWLVQAAGLMGLLIGVSASLQASEPRMLISKDEASVRVSLHIDNTIVVGEAWLRSATSGLLTIDLHDFRAMPAEYGVNTYGSGTGSDKSRCGASGVQTYGSGTGSERGQCGNSGLLTYGSGTGSDRGPCSTSGVKTYGSGTGSAGCDCSTSGLQTYGSGTGSINPCTRSTLRWGTAELVFDANSTYILIHRDGPEGAIEVLATVQTNTSNQSAVEREIDFSSNPILIQR